MRAIARALAVTATVSVAAAVRAAPETRYEGARLACLVPTGTRVKDVADVATDYALELVAPPALELEQTTLRLLVSNIRVTDAETESVASAWRDVRVRNRSSWGVPKRQENRPEVILIGSRRFFRLSDQMGSVMGAAHQLMLCGAISSRLVCGVAMGPTAQEKAAEAVLTRVLETASVKKPPKEAKEAR